MRLENVFPDGTVMDPWFAEELPEPELSELGRPYVLTDYGVMNDGRVCTKQLQALIDRAADEGGGVIVVPEGRFVTGAVWLRPNVNLYIRAGGILQGSDDPADFPLCDTRIEGESCRYLPALINAENMDGLVIAGHGTIDGNGLRYWRAFRMRREWNPQCTNKDEQRPRLLFVSGCRNVTLYGLQLQNSPFWTTHWYRCGRVRIENCRITSPKEPVKAPSTDAVDIDVCTDVRIRNCYLSVNDDAVALKGGKGPDADVRPENGANERILMEDCSFGFCHGCMTLGSEAVHCRNIVLRRCRVESAYQVLWLKFRPDTPQHYEYVEVSDIEGACGNFLPIRPWTQFYDLHGNPAPPPSKAEHIRMRGCRMQACICFAVELREDQYSLSDFVFEDLEIAAEQEGVHLPGAEEKNVRISIIPGSR